LCRRGECAFHFVRAGVVGPLLEVGAAHVLKVGMVDVERCTGWSPPLVAVA
jgi:hypothetical protein